MKKITAIWAASLATASISSAQELSVSATVAWESEYVFRGVQLADEYYSPAIDISYGDFYAGLWAALPVESKYGNEVDFYAGYGFGLTDVISADVGFTYYTYPDGSDGFFDDDVNTFEVYTGLSFDAALSPSVYVFYDFDLEALTFEGSIGHSVEAGENGTVDFSAYVGIVDPDEGDQYMYYGAGVSYSYALAENASISISGNYYGADEDYMFGGNDNKISWGLSFTSGF